MIRTMVVDDQEDVRVLLRLVIELGDEGLKVSCEAASGREALAKLDRCDPRVVVLDQMMPGMNGIETAVRIKSERPGQLLILCTAYLDPDVAAGARAAGVNAVLHKDEITTLPALIREVATA
jgi:two-component system, chemotaxis family, chemotaxis protein CheY